MLAGMLSDGGVHTDEECVETSSWTNVYVDRVLEARSDRNGADRIFSCAPRHSPRNVIRTVSGSGLGFRCVKV